jgi:hypothetical protein
MPVVSLPGLFNLQVIASDGTPAESHRIYTYITATTTHKIAYTDAAGSVPHTYTNDGIGGQYIALNARGELPAPLWLTTGGYDIALKTPAGATVWTRSVEGSAEPIDADVAMGGFKHTGAGTATAAGQYLVYDQSALGPQFYRYPTIQIVAPATTGITSIPVASIAQGGGGLLIIRGPDDAGEAFCAIWNVAVKVNGGSGSDVVGTQISRVGATNPVVTAVSNSGGFVAVTMSSTGDNYTYVTGIGF